MGYFHFDDFFWTKFKSIIFYHTSRVSNVSKVAMKFAGAFRLNRKAHRTGTPAGRNRSSDARGMMKQSRSSVARDIGSPLGGLLPETMSGV